MPDDETERSFQPPPPVAPEFAEPPLVETVRPWQKFVAYGLLLFQLVPISVVAWAWISVPKYESIFSDMGVRLPTISRFVLGTYQFWIAIPIVTISMAILCFRRIFKTAKFQIITLALTLISSIAMFFMLLYGLSAPIWGLLQAAQ